MSYFIGKAFNTTCPQDMVSKVLMKYKIFLSYSIGENWIARNIANELTKMGVEVFLDCLVIEPGKDIEQEILNNLLNCNELWVLVTPTISHIKPGLVPCPYIWLEIGVALSRNIPIIPILINVSAISFHENKDIPLALNRRKNIVDQ